MHPAKDLSVGLQIFEEIQQELNPDNIHKFVDVFDLLVKNADVLLDSLQGVHVNIEKA